MRGQPNRWLSSRTWTGVPTSASASAMSRSRSRTRWGVRIWVGFVQSADPDSGELLVGFTTEIPGEKFYLHAFADELVFKEVAHV